MQLDQRVSHEANVWRVEDVLFRDWKYTIPDVVLFAVSFSISNEAGAELVKVLAAVVATETGHMPLHVWIDSEQVLVNDALFAAETCRHFLINSTSSSDLRLNTHMRSCI